MVTFPFSSLSATTSNILLKNPDTYYPIISIAFILPFISLSSIIRGYFFGKQKNSIERNTAA